MSVGPASNRNNSVSDTEAAARRAAEEARRAAEAAARAAAEAARMAAEAQRAAAAQQAASKATTCFEGQGRQTEFDKRLGVDTQASSLLTEDVHDNKQNCLDVAADWVDKATPALRARSQAVFLEDTRPGVEGQSGHVVIRQGDKILDPTTHKSYESMEAFKKAQPHYREAGSLSANQVKSILDTRPGSPERAAALEKAKVPPELQKMMVADTKRPLNPDSVRKADEDYQRLKEKGTAAGWGPYVAETLEHYKGDKDYQARFMERLKEGGSESILAHVGMEHFNDAQANRTPEEKKNFLDALKTSYEAGTLNDADLQSLRNLTPQWKGAVDTLGLSNVDRAPQTDSVMSSVSEATKKYNEAADNAKKKDTELAAHLAKLGPSLSDEQRAAYIKAFQDDPKNQEVYAAKEKALKALSDTIKNNPSALTNAAITRPEDAKTLQDALTKLADSSEAKVAMEAALALTTDAKASQAFSKSPEFYNELIKKALPHMAAQEVANTKDPKDALEKFTDQLEKYKPLYDVVGGKDRFVEGMEALKHVENSKQPWTALERLKQLSAPGVPEAAGDLSPVGPETTGALAAGFSGAGVIFGAAFAAKEQRDGEYQKALKETFGVGRDSLELYSAVSGSLANQGKLARFGVTSSDDLVRTAKLTRLAPGLGVAASFLSASIRVEDLKDSKDPGQAIALMGDTLSALGSAAEVFPLSAPAGLLINGAGAVVTAGGEAVSNWWKGDQLEKDQKKYLQAAGIDDQVGSALVDSSPEQLKLLRDALGMSPAKLQELVKLAPDLVQSEVTKDMTQRFVSLMLSHSVSGDQVVTAMEKLKQGGKYDYSDLRGFLYDRGEGFKTQKEWGQELEDYKNRRVDAPKPGFIDALRQALQP
ncbi:hypothetical protein LZ198_16485 [Myxococcus sp. K15C18031901]|uniref:hypothetical protein n=1 Tax=Myxococcus dinghuensis TaxID=2906761 RepID=UPI0020A71A00|nr:hypothetical protein [Myxococcus dinghuensis]MCP3100468.1 hypothetical protein [Myxococcus dinghuensis]